MSCSGGTIADDPSILYYDKVVRKDTARYLTNIKTEQEGDTESNTDDNNMDVTNDHVKSNSVNNITNNS